MVVKTNWFVITGGPYSGKSTTLDWIAFKGYLTIPERAKRLNKLLELRGKSLEDFRGENSEPFDKRVFRLRRKVEERLDPKEQIFLDRAVPDSIHYYKDSNLNPNPIIEEAQKRKYKKVFIMEVLPDYIKEDYRIEDRKKAVEIGEDLKEVYSSLGYQPIKVPVMDIKRRVRFILGKIK